MDLGAWLRSLGLEQYEAAFRENAIDPSILPDLTDQDLEKLGILLGHRRKLLRAIAEARACSARADSVGFPGRSGWQILSALIRVWERERCRRPTLLIFEVE
jgi:hypothetical protein